MEPEFSDTPEQDPAPDQSRERVSSYDLMVMEGVDLAGLDQKKEDMRTIFDQIQEKASSALELSLKWEDLDEQFGFLKQRAIEAELKEASVRKQTLELETSLKQLQARENELSLLNDTIKEKSTELEKKEETFLLKQQTEAREIEVKSKFLELKEKELEEREKEIGFKQREMEERAIQAKTRKRSRLESEPSLLAEKGSDADQSFIRPGKRHKPNSTQHNHYDEDKDKDSAFLVSDSTSSPVQISEALEGDIDDAVSVDDSDEDREPLMCVDSEFNDFSKTMSSFMVGQVWALYDPRDDMPRCYGRIKRIIKFDSSLQVTWLDPKDEESVPVACGRFKWGTTDIVKSHLTFSHEMHPIIHGRNYIAVNPIKGETWALFRDWSNSWNSNPEQHKPPYRYDFVEVLHNFGDHVGVGVAYLGQVEGFVSVFKQAGQHGVVSLMITPEEMHRFSHRVPSFRLTGEEKKGVPAGSFELDPAALPSSTLNRKTGEVEDQDGSRTDFPIILD